MPCSMPGLPSASISRAKREGAEQGGEPEVPQCPVQCQAGDSLVSAQQGVREQGKERARGSPMLCSILGRRFASINRAGSEGAEQGASQRLPLDGDQKSSGITLNGCSEALTLPILRLGSLTGSAGSFS